MQEFTIKLVFIVNKKTAGNPLRPGLGFSVGTFQFNERDIFFIKMVTNVHEIIKRHIRII